MSKLFPFVFLSEQRQMCTSCCQQVASGGVISGVIKGCVTKKKARSLGRKCTANYTSFSQLITEVASSRFLNVFSLQWWQQHCRCHAQMCREQTELLKLLALGILSELLWMCRLPVCGSWCDVKGKNAALLPSPHLTAHKLPAAHPQKKQHSHIRSLFLRTILKLNKR